MPNTASPPSGDPSQPSIGVVRETRAHERRVALTPAVVTQYTKLGLRVIVETGAGAAAGFPDADYEAKGAQIGTRADALGADVLAAVQIADGDPASPDIQAMRPGQVVVGTAAPFANLELTTALNERGVTAFSLELLPRTTRAQSMDILSSQANIAGYKAVLLAAERLPKVYPLLTTAAGTLPPARVFIIGVGVAGLSAIATARRLGAVVEAYDVRPAVKEEVKSLGARFIELDLDTGQEGSGSGAYATKMSDDTIKRQQELMAKTIANADVVITTAQVQGSKAPVLVTQAMVEGMRPGSVIVDLAAEQGGNVEPSAPGEVVDVNGVSVIGPINVPSTVAQHASLVFAKNVANFVALMVKDGGVNAGIDDDLVHDTKLCHGGEIRHGRVREAHGLEPLPAPAAPVEPEATPDQTDEVTA
ncbi:MAG TPA: NAD(P) transhydrogenase subunit alpha [Miltoncostaeaceae bacterium]|nr:NAD(P) transhydrogenase subunit alpha [Miltoncostaeaceae bacterium]